jgi:hypothetical protein
MQSKEKIMVKAIVNNGVFVPQEPLPNDWTDGVEVEVDRPAPTADELAALDRWYAELEAQASQLDPEDDRILKEAVAQIQRQEKELARKQLGLPK